MARTTRSSGTTFSVITLSPAPEDTDTDENGVTQQGRRMRTPVPDAPDLLTSAEAEHASVLPAAKRYKLSNAAVHGLNTAAKMMVDAFEAEDGHLEDRIEMEVDGRAQALSTTDMIVELLKEVKLLRKEVEVINSKLPTLLPLLEVSNTVREEGRANIEAAVKKAWWNPNCPGYSHHCRAIEELVVRMTEKKPEMLGTNGGQLMDIDNADGHDAVLSVIRACMDSMRFAWKQKIYDAAGGGRGIDKMNLKDFVEDVLLSCSQLKLTWGLIYRV
ncbi:unnamed protein product, partial [Tilletia controversa]